jgi:hypothetical protein
MSTNNERVNRDYDGNTTTQRSGVYNRKDFGDSVRQSSDEMMQRGQVVARDISNRACEFCGDMKRRHPILLTCCLIVCAFLLGIGCTTVFSRVGLFGNYYYPDRESIELHRALDTILRQYREHGGVTGFASEKYQQAKDRLGYGDSWRSWKENIPFYSMLHRNDEGVVMRTVHDAEDKLARLLHGTGDIVQNAWETVRRRRD